MRHEVRMRFAHILFYAGFAGEALRADYNRNRDRRAHLNC